MSLSTWELQALDSIKDGLAGSDPDLATLLTTFTRLAADEEMPARATLQARSRRAIQRSRRSGRRGAEQAGQAYQRSRHAVLTWLLVTMVMIGAALALSRGNSQAACSGSVFGPACANPAPASGAPFAGQAPAAGHLPG
jgi:hypothetical protein